ncbi:hypothetical protein NQZ79_g6794 [Umbelopsis isabellina]|nr:hypothetical protein NQZ79_g6794 [Umbelopsis isabellina]
MTTDTISFQISFKGTLYELNDRDPQSTVQELKQHLQDLTDVPVGRQKLMFKGLMKNEQTLSEAKVGQGSKIMLIGSKDEDIKQVQEIDKRVERMKTTPIHKAKVYKSGTSKEDIRYNFHKISVIEEFPEPEKARKLLERLKNDRGIRHVMKQYQWSVGELTELTPFERTILGYNRNKGELISLRLRTDDMEGFRHYDSIRKVLLHELTHNVWSEHDHRFHQLNRELEIVANPKTFDGSKLSSAEVYTPDDDEEAIDSAVTWEAGSYRLGGKSTMATSDTLTPEQMRNLRAQAATMRMTKEDVDIEHGCGSSSH